MPSRRSSSSPGRARSAPGRSRSRKPTRPSAGTAPKTGRTAKRAAARPVAAEPGTARRRGGFTGRAAALGLVLCVVVLSLAYPLREFLSQRAEIDHMEAEQRERLARVVALEKQAERYDDPAFVRAEARRRLQYTNPGEQSYVVIDPSAAAEPRVRTGRSSAGRADERPWYTQLWHSVEDAGRPVATTPAPSPAP